MKLGRLGISYLKYVLGTEILTVITENLLEMAFCGTDFVSVSGITIFLSGH